MVNKMLLEFYIHKPKNCIFIPLINILHKMKLDIRILLFENRVLTRTSGPKARHTLATSLLRQQKSCVLTHSGENRNCSDNDRTHMFQSLRAHWQLNS